MNTAQTSASHTPTDTPNDQTPTSTNPFGSMLGFLQGDKPAYLPPEPIKRQRGWGGKSILEDD